MIPSEVGRYFPQDSRLKLVGATSYLGEALKDSAGVTMGHLCVMNDGPLPPQQRLRSVFRIFALRAAAELERTKSRNQLRMVLYRLDVLVKNLRAIVILEDEERHVLMVNEPFCKRFAPDQTPADFTTIPSEQIAQIMARMFPDPGQFEAGLAGLHRAGMIRRHEKLTLTDGSVLWRDYLPILMDGVNRGHLWIYRETAGGGMQSKSGIRVNEPVLAAGTDAGGEFPAEVLVVDDHDISRRLLLSMLQDVGCRVHEITDGVHVESFLKKSPVQVILLDLQMPGMDGYATARQLRSSPEMRDVWLVAMTASATEDTLPRCREAGMNDFVRKPLSREVLYAALLRAKTRTESSAFKMAEPMGSVQLLDLEQWNNVSDNGTAEVVAILREFVREIPGQIDVLRTAEKAGDRMGLKRMAHQLKGTASSFGMARLSALAASLEKNFDSDKAGNSSLIECISTTLVDTVAELQSAIPGMGELKD